MKNTSRYDCAIFCQAYQKEKRALCKMRLFTEDNTQKCKL